VGLDPAPDKAWRWIAWGGFANDVLGQPGIGGCSLSVIKNVHQFFGTGAVKWEASDALLLPPLVHTIRRSVAPEHAKRALNDAMEALEVMVSEGWVQTELNPALNRLQIAARREDHVLGSGGWQRAYGLTFGCT
jgi:hypothetical protein